MIEKRLKNETRSLIGLFSLNGSALSGVAGQVL